MNNGMGARQSSLSTNTRYRFTVVKIDYTNVRAGSTPSSTARATGR